MRKDSDLDGLLDSVETASGVFLNPSDTGTDPLVADTDGGGIGDGVEVDRGENPFDASDDRVVALASWLPVVTEEYLDFLNAARQVFPDFTVEEIETAEELAATITGHRILIFSAELPTDDSTDALSAFVQSGGVVLGLEGASQYLNDRGLFPHERRSRIRFFSDYRVAETDSPFMVDVRPEFMNPTHEDAASLRRTSSALFGLLDGVSRRLIERLECDSAAIVERTFGAGRIVLVGFDYTESSEDSRRIAGNLIEQSFRVMDRDGDGIPDSVEQEWGLDPSDASDAAMDRDGDGLDHSTEYAEGSGHRPHGLGCRRPRRCR